MVIPDMTGFENAGAPNREPRVQAVVLACSEAQGPLVLVGHGGAAPLLPAMTLGLLGRVKRVVFVEAALPPASGFAEPAPSWLRDNVAVFDFGQASSEMVEVVGRGCVGEADPRPRCASSRGGGRPTRAPPRLFR